MAVNLQVWLHCAVKTQLDLGHSWLQAQNQAKAQRDRPSADVDARWKGIYHDNGSCIDISGPLAPVHAQVLVLQTDPLVVTDGRHHCETSLTSACRRRLLDLHPNRDITAGTVWAVEKYIIRYTSYGPARAKFRLLLDHLAWVGQYHTSSVCVDPANALNRCHDIASTLRQLDHTRLREDLRCLQSHTKHDEEDPDHPTHTMAGARESLDRDAAMNTQMPFGTQMPHPIRSRRDSDDVAFVGINRMEPILAGSTQRAELKPRSGNPLDVGKLAQPYDAGKRAQLLSLLGGSHTSAPPQSPNRNTPPGPGLLNERNTIPHPRPRETPTKRPNPDTFQDSYAGATQTPTDKGKKRMRDAENDSPSTHQPAKKASFSEDDPQQSSVSEMDKFAAECSWMKGLKLNRASATVPDDQALLLQKPESWYKPEPGRRSVNEVPAQTRMILSRLADEAAALEGATSSGSYHETNPSSGSYPANSAPQPIDEESSTSEDEPPTSPVSWQTSPSPEPPQQPTFSRQGLPPDSSIEMPEDDAEVVRSQRSKRGSHSQNQALPASSHAPEIGFPPSSPPARQTAADSDVDMDLETSVPQELGEDFLSRPTVQSQIPRAEPRPRSVVQVVETPYVKGKNGHQPVVTISPPTQSSNAQSETSSSASIVRGTYEDLGYSVIEETRLDALQKDNREDLHPIAAAMDQTHTAEAQLLQEHDAQTTSLLENTGRQETSERQTRNLRTEAVQDISRLQPEPTPMSAQLPPKDSSSGEQAAPTPNKGALTMPSRPRTEATRRGSATPSLTKRKRSPTTSKDRGPGSKRRKLRKVPFGTVLSKVDGERQRSTTSADSRQGSVSNQSAMQVADTKAEDFDIRKPAQPRTTETTVAVEREMSPRHQSLYAPPSPVLRPAARPVVATAPESDFVAQTEQVAPVMPVAGQDVAKETDTLQQVRVQPPPKGLSVLPQEPQEKPASAPTPEPERASMSKPQQPEPEILARVDVPANVPAPATVFEKFTTAYSEYKGTVGHFKSQCRLIEKLDREDKMVPKSMWDDFIIRHSIDYKRYVSDCIDAGDDQMPYIRFYKDVIEYPIYMKKVVASRTTLIQTLKELGVQAGADEPAPLQPSNQQHVQQASHQSPEPLVQQPIDARPSQQQLKQQASPQSFQPSPRQPSPQQTRSPMPPPSQPMVTPPKKKKPRKSLPSSIPSTSTPARTDSKASVRYSLDASSFRAPSSSAARPPASARSKDRSAFGDVLRGYKNDSPSSSVGSSTGQEFRDFLRAQRKLTSTTGSSRVDRSKPWPASVEERLDVRDLPKKKIDVLEWKDEL